MRVQDLGSIGAYAGRAYKRSNELLIREPYKGLGAIGGFFGLIAGMPFGPVGMMLGAGLGAGYGASMGAGIYAARRLYRETGPTVARIKKALNFA